MAGVLERAGDDMPRQMRHVVGAFGNLEQRPSADPSDLRVIPARQCLGADQAVVFERILRLEQDLDLVAIDCVEQVRFELMVRMASARDFAGRPVDPAAVVLAHAFGKIGKPVEHAIGIVVRSHPDQSNPRP